MGDKSDASLGEMKGIYPAEVRVFNGSACLCRVFLLILWEFMRACARMYLNLFLTGNIWQLIRRWQTM